MLKSKKWYKHQSKPITEATILCDFAIQIDRKIKNRPNTVVKDYERKIHLIDISEPI